MKDTNLVMASRKTMSVLSSQTTRVITLPIDLYATLNYTGSTSFYSLSNGVGIPLLYVNILSSLSSNPEFTAYLNQYSLFKFGKVVIQCDSTFQGSNYVLDLPNAFAAISVINSPSSITAAGIARSDNSFEFRFNNTQTQSARCVYKIPPLIEGISGYGFGSNVWNPTTSTTWTNAAFYLALGYLNAPAFTGLATNTAFRVGVIQVKIPVTFASPNILN
jgi:hypothetical protein